MLLSFNLLLVLLHITLAVAQRPAIKHQDLIANTIPAQPHRNETLAQQVSLQDKQPRVQSRASRYRKAGGNRIGVIRKPAGRAAQPSQVLGRKRSQPSQASKRKRSQPSNVPTRKRSKPSNVPTRKRSQPSNVPTRKRAQPSEMRPNQLGRWPPASPVQRAVARRGGAAPTPQPTGPSSTSTTVYINGESDFALILPQKDGEYVSNAENDGVAYCTAGPNCQTPFPDNFITGASISRADDGSYIQVTGCLDSSKFHFAPNDTGGQIDVRFPNGAQCSFGGYGASFIEQVEPSNNRFCLRCCASANDQVNCNSHNDKAGCPAAIPGTYDFPGVSCS